MKKTVILLLMMLMVQVSWAAKAQRGPAKIKQKDGTTLVIRGFGDEHFHYYVTTDGSTTRATTISSPRWKRMVR